jgi:hypothetical protein
MQSGTVRAGGGAEEAAAGEYTCSGRTIQLLLRRWLLLAAGRWPRLAASASALRARMLRTYCTS